MNIKINIVGQMLTAEAGRPELVDGSQNFIKFTFCFDDNLWDDLEVWAVFAQGETNLKRKIVDGTVYLPPEITAGFCYISLLGTNDTTVATTGKYLLALDKNMVANDAIVSVDGTAGFLLTSADKANITAIADALRQGVFDISKFATVATSGKYSDLLDKPEIPKNTSDLTNDSGYLSTKKLTWDTVTHPALLDFLKSIVNHGQYSFTGGSFLYHYDLIDTKLGRIYGILKSYSSDADNISTSLLSGTSPQDIDFLDIAAPATVVEVNALIDAVNQILASVVGGDENGST